jgi:release factor glutamine methyltransferase
VSGLRSATVSEVLREATERLAAAGCETPRLDAEVLLAFAMGWERADLVLKGRAALSRAHVAPAPPDAPPPSDDAPDFGALLERRLAREPVAYITGVKPFRRLEVAVDPRVLIPRPETELLVEAGLNLPAGARVVDVGTGSGAVALALKDERPDLHVRGVDVSPAALEVAAANAARLRLDVEFAPGDLLAGVSGVDAVLANLPYVADGTRLAPEIERFEPREALFAGADGLDVIRRLAQQLDGVPFAALEIGAGQADAVEALLRAAGFGSVERLRDLAGIERVMVARR